MVPNYHKHLEEAFDRQDKVVVEEEVVAMEDGVGKSHVKSHCHHYALRVFVALQRHGLVWH